jgi:hypothetical protein
MLAGEEGSAIRQSVERLTPVGRVGPPADIAGLVAFLCGPDAGFMTGAYLLMDGGIQDARPQPGPSDPRWEEWQRHRHAAQQRRERLQPLIDAR